MPVYDGIIVRKWEGVEPVTSPYGIEFVLTQGTLFNILYKYYDFENHLKAATTVRSQPEDADYEHNLKHVEELKKAIANGQVKITVKIEIEKDARKINTDKQNSSS